MMILSKFTPNGTVAIPGSKSQTIRALLIALSNKSISKIHNPLFSEDTKALIDIIRQLGGKVTSDNNILTVDSSDIKITKGMELDCKNSGTSLYLSLGLLSKLGQGFILKGDEQLSSRPIRPLLDAYRTLGLKIEDKNNLPIRIEGELIGGNCSIECPTSQYLSSLLLALPLAKKESNITCPILFEKPYVEMTLSWLDKQNIKYRASEDLKTITVYPNQKYSSFEDTIYGDFSSATFFFVLAAIHRKGIRIKGLNKNDRQGDKKVLDILIKMGCDVSWEDDELEITRKDKLKGGHFDLNDIPDSLPALSILAAFCDQSVYLENVENARIKETDRIKVMRENLEAVGVRCEETPSSLIIHGNGTVKGGFVKGYKDHRIIMALAIMATNADGKIKIDDTEAVNITFPTFFKLLDEMRIKTND